MATLPSIPAAQNVSVSPFQMPFQPLSLAQSLSFNQKLFEQQMRQQETMRDEWMDEGHEAAEMAEFMLQFEKEWGPQYVEQFNERLTQAQPEWMQAFQGLGARVNEGLEAGYELGPGLTREMQQAIRAGQTARGNWMGAAPTAQEAFGLGEASINLYNMRLGQAQNFLQGRSPVDMWAAANQGSALAASGAGAAMGLAMQTPAYSGQLANQAFGTVSQGIANYNATAASAYGSFVQGQIGAAQINNQSAFDRYSAQFDQFLYKQSVQQGIYSQPSVGGGGSSWMGSAIGGIGAGVSAGIGAAAMGATAAGAVGAGVGAAASAAAAAICWVARKVMPDNWREFREFLFTKAPAWFRRKYVAYGRRFAESLSDDQALHLRKVMEQCLLS